MADEVPTTQEFYTRDLVLRLNLTIPGDVTAIGPVVDKVMWVLAEIQVAVDKEFEIETALRESLANAVVHGCKQDPTKTVQFFVAADKARGVMIVVRDPGSGFDPEHLPNPVVGECLYSEHGRGIFLINRLMDDVKFSKGGTEIRMRKG